AQVREPALVAAPGRVANDHRQQIDAKVIVVGPPDGAADQEPPVAAAQVEDERRVPAEQGVEVEAAVGGGVLQCRLRPPGRIAGFAGDGHANLALDLPAFLLRLHNVPRGAVCFLFLPRRKLLYTPRWRGNLDTVF